MQRFLYIITGLVMSIMLSACAHHNPYYNPQLPHHTPDGFKNPYIDQTPTEAELLGWYYHSGCGL